MEKEEFDEVMDALKRAEQIVSMAYWRQRCVSNPPIPKCDFCGERADHPKCREAIEAGYGKKKEE